MTAKSAASRTAAAISLIGNLQRIGERLILRLPDAASAQLPSRGQVAVQAVMNDHPFDTVLEPDGRKGHWLAINGDVQKALSLDDIAAVTLDLELSKQWPEPDVPEDLEAALAEAGDVSDTWQGITPMARWEWVRSIRATKSPETRDRRIDVSISKLRSGKRRPCCFDLASCTDPEVSKSGKLIEDA